MQECCGELGYKRVAMNSDQETAMSALQQRVQKAVNAEMVLTSSKRYDSKSNGKVAKPIHEVEGHIRTLKLHTEDHIGKTIPPEHPVIHWLVECVAEVINICLYVCLLRFLHRFALCYGS